MATLLKRKLTGVLTVITGTVAVLLYIASLVGGWLWLRSVYSGPLELASFWQWLSDPGRRNMEPILALTALILSPVVAIVVRLVARLRTTSAPYTVMAMGPTIAAKPTEWNRIRGDLIRTVRTHWIDDYLRHSVYQRIRIKLGVEKTPEAIDHPYDIERISGGNGELVTNVSLLRLFDESGGSLLILGEPGSGKTVTLVQLARLLLDRAASDPEAAVPVVVPLASWAAEKNPLEEWLRRELVHHYGLSARTTPALLEEGKRLILLLDGLDEVRESFRANCLAAIQRFKASFAADVVVCCRVAEYEALPQKIPHGDAIRILPLTARQIDAYFAAFGGRLDPLIQSLRERAELRELAATPLMLNILATIYGSEERIAEVPASASLDTSRDAIFIRYVRLMFQRKERKATDGAIIPEDVTFTREQAVHWLQQIAGRMVKQQITTLYLERLNPNWVISRWKYVFTEVLVCSFVSGLVFALFSGLKIPRMPEGLITALTAGLICGAILALILEFTGMVQLVEGVRFRFNGRELIRGLIRGFFIGLISGLIGSVIFGLVCVLIGLHIGQWVVMLVMGLLAGLAVGLSIGLSVGLTYGLISGLIEMRSHPEPAEPNQGIRNSAKASLVGGVILAILAGLAGRIMTPAFGFILGAVLFGGGAVMRHYSIRLTLAWEGTLRFPLSDRRLTGFLDAMRDRILVTRVGGGWIFIHRLLLEFLAGEPFGANPDDIEKNLKQNAAKSDIEK